MPVQIASQPIAGEALSTDAAVFVQTDHPLGRHRLGTQRAVRPFVVAEHFATVVICPPESLAGTGPTLSRSGQTTPACDTLMVGCICGRSLTATEAMLNHPMKHSQDYLGDSRPAVGLEDEYQVGFVDPMHCHTRAQLLYASAGVMTVVTERHSFLVPPLRAAWLPAGMMHEVCYRGPASLRTFYIDPSYDSEPSRCRVLEVSDFLRALILEAVGFESGYKTDSREGRIVSLLLQEVARMPSAPCRVGMPAEPRLKRICMTILGDPADTRLIDDWAALAGMSRRSFTRTFRQELGMSFALWRQQVRLVQAVSLLATGRSIASVAFDVGYESPSAFTAMFHRAFGEAPSVYVSR